MNNRSPALVLGLAIAACLALAVCGAVAAGGYFLLLNRNLLTALNVVAPGQSNQIVFVGNDQNIYVADATTGKTTPVTKDGGSNRVYNLPTWAPDNRRLAFVGYDLSNGNTTAGTLFTASPTGDNLTAVYTTLENFPFYLYWSPNSKLIGFLANKDQQQLALRVARTDEANSMQEVDSGSPLYWAWSPDSARLFTHVGGTRAQNSQARLGLLNFKSSQDSRALAALPGEFQAPQWSQDGKILFSTQDGADQAIALTDAANTSVKKLISYQGRASFELSPDGKQVAYLITDSNVRLPHFGPVQVVSADGGESKPVSNDPALAFLWSPDSKKLALLMVDLANNQSNFEFRAALSPLAALDPEKFSSAPTYNQGGQQQRIQLQWQVWDSVTGTTRLAATFIPTPNFLNVVPYFDQYANSSTFWSPDSRSLVYTISSTANDGSIWIADSTGANPPRKIGDGSVAFWSWK